MEMMAGRKSRRRRSVTTEFKAEVVALVGEPGRTVGNVPGDLDLTETAVRERVKQTERDEGKCADGLSGPKWASCAGPREERDILKRAALSLPGRPREPASVRRGGEG